MPLVGFIPQVFICKFMIWTRLTRRQGLYILRLMPSSFPVPPIQRNEVEMVKQ